MKCFGLFVLLLVLASGLCSAASTSEQELFVAVQNGNSMRVLDLLERGTSANAKFDSDDKPILLVAVSRDIVLEKMAERDSRGKRRNDFNIEIVKMLLDHGADINAKQKDGLTALMQAVLKGQSEMARILVERGADINAKAMGGGTALALALLVTREEADPVVPSRLELAELLVRNGADVNAGDNTGSTPLMFAITERHIPGEKATKSDLVRFLMKNGADVNAAANSGATPLMLAAYLNEPEIAAVLLDNGARINAKDARGYTALIVAADAGAPEIVVLLIRRGADVRVKTGDGDTPLSAARAGFEASGKETRYVETIRLLEEAGATERGTGNNQPSGGH